MRLQRVKPSARNLPFRSPNQWQDLWLREYSLYHNALEVAEPVKEKAPETAFELSEALTNIAEVESVRRFDSEKSILEKLYRLSADNSVSDGYFRGYVNCLLENAITAHGNYRYQ